VRMQRAQAGIAHLQGAHQARAALGQVVAVQPLAAMRSSQSLASGFLNTNFLPPQVASSSADMGVRMDGGQLASSHARVSARNVSRLALVMVLDPTGWLRVSSRGAGEMQPENRASAVGRRARRG